MAEPIELVDADDPGLDGPEAGTRPSRSRWPRPAARSGVGLGRVDAAALAAVMALLTVLWGRGGRVWYWVDEGISVGIAGHPLSRIPAVLRLDGSPPFYYVLLHVWIRLFGSSEPATHLLSLGLALAIVPAALWAGWSLFGRRTGWICAALAALSPFLGEYANETRMYSLLALLSVLCTAGLIHVFVFRRRRHLALVVVTTALLLYTHNWSAFLVAAAGATAVAAALLAADRRRALLDVVLAFGGAGLLYAPWLPSLAYQLAHTGTPFLLPPTLLKVREDIIGLLGGREAMVALGLGAAPAYVAMAGRRRDPVTLAVAAAAALTVATVGLAWVVSRREPVWEVRYLAVLLGPLLFTVAAGLARGGRTAMGALVVAGLLMAPIGVKGQLFRKSNIRQVVAEMAPELRAGDLVITDYGRAPVVNHYLGRFGEAGIRLAETTGPVPDPGVSDQREGVRQLEENDPARDLAVPLAAVPSGGRVLVLCAPEPKFNEDAPRFILLIQERCEQSLALVQGDPRFVLTRAVSGKGEIRHPIDGFLFSRVPLAAGQGT